MEQIWFYTDFVSRGSNEAIVLLNTFLRENFKKAIFVAKDEKELQNVLKEQEFIQDLKYDFHNNTLTTRENLPKECRK